LIEKKLLRALKISGLGISASRYFTIIY